MRVLTNDLAELDIWTPADVAAFTGTNIKTALDLVRRLPHIRRAVATWWLGCSPQRTWPLARWITTRPCRRNTMSGPSAELHVSALREPLLGATSDRMSEKPRLDVVIGKERSRIWLPRDLWAEVEPGNGGLDVTVRNGDRLYVVSKGVRPTSRDVNGLVAELVQVVGLAVDDRLLRIELLNALSQVSSGHDSPPTPISEIPDMVGLSAELTGQKFLRGEPTVTMGPPKSFKTIDHVRHGLAQTLGRSVGYARAGMKMPFLHLLYEDPEPKIRNIAEAIARGLGEELPTNYYIRHMHGSPLVGALPRLQTWCGDFDIGCIAVDTLGQARGEDGDVHSNTNRYFAALSRSPADIAVSTSDHIPPGRLGEEAGEVSNTLHGAHRGDRSQRAFTESCQAGFRFRRSPVPSQPAQLWSQRRHLVRKRYLHDKDDRQRGRIEILALRHDFV